MSKKLTAAEAKKSHQRGLARMKQYRQRQREHPESIQMLTTVPDGAYEKVRRWASESASKGAIARRLGMDPKTFRALMERDLAHPALAPVAEWFDANIPADLRAALGGRFEA